MTKDLVVVPPSSPVSSCRNMKSQLVLVCVPPGVGPGTNMQVTITTTNETMTVTVPPGGVSQFYVTKHSTLKEESKNTTEQQEMKQHNWQDHPYNNSIPLIARPRAF